MRKNQPVLAGTLHIITKTIIAWTLNTRYLSLNNYDSSNWLTTTTGCCRSSQFRDTLDDKSFTVTGESHPVISEVIIFGSSWILRLSAIMQKLMASCPDSLLLVCSLHIAILWGPPHIWQLGLGMGQRTVTWSVLKQLKHSPRALALSIRFSRVS